MAHLGHGTWVRALIGVGVVAYSIYLRAIWHRLRSHGGKSPVRPSRFPKLAEGSKNLVDGRIRFYGPLWPAILLMGLDLLTLYGPLWPLLAIALVAIFVRLLWMLAQQ